MSNMNKIELNKLNNANGVDMHNDDANIDIKSTEPVDVSSNQKTKAETETAPQAEDHKPQHVITFVGNGIWTDNNGIGWKNKADNLFISTKTFSDEEYEKRDDIKFMVEYGVMQHIVVDE